MNGKGQYPKTQDIQTTNSTHGNEIASDIKPSLPSKKMEIIVVFYTDGTFDEYKKG